MRFASESALCFRGAQIAVNNNENFGLKRLGWVSLLYDLIKADTWPYVGRHGHALELKKALEFTFVRRIWLASEKIFSIRSNS